MSLLGLLLIILVLAVIGYALWYVNVQPKIDGKLKLIINIFVVVVVVLWLLQAFGVLGSIQNVRIN